MAKKYVSPECSVILQMAEDVITASTWEKDGDYGQDWIWGEVRQ